MCKKFFTGHAVKSNFSQAYFSIEPMFFTAESREAMQQLNALIFLYAIKNRDNNIR